MLALRAKIEAAKIEAESVLVCAPSLLEFLFFRYLNYSSAVGKSK